MFKSSRLPFFHFSFNSQISLIYQDSTIVKLCFLCKPCEKTIVFGPPEFEQKIKNEIPKLAFYVLQEILLPY